MGVDSRNVAVANVLGVSESVKTLWHYACAAKTLPGGLRNFYKHRAQTPGEGRERYCLSVYSNSYQLTGDR